VVLLLVKREYRIQCDWTDKPDTREIDSALAGQLCKPKKRGKPANARKATPPSYWLCRHCPPTGCPTP
jgi:hypothetical protein